MEAGFVMGSFDLNENGNIRFGRTFREDANWPPTGVYEAVSEATASGSSQSKVAAWEFVDGLMADHRTSQSNVVRALLEILVTFAAADPGTDARNESAVARAKQVAHLLKSDEGFPVI